MQTPTIRQGQGYGAEVHSQRRAVSSVNRARGGDMLKSQAEFQSRDSGDSQASGAGPAPCESSLPSSFPRAPAPLIVPVSKTSQYFCEHVIT